MKKVQTIKFNDFMSGDYKAKERAQKRQKAHRAAKVVIGVGLPLAMGNVAGVALGASRALACGGATPVSAPLAIEVGAKEWAGRTTLDVITHALDPIVDIMVALAFPIASVIMVGACFFFMFGKSDKAWEMIMKAGLGYILIQMSPLFLKILREVGNAV